MLNVGGLTKIGSMMTAATSQPPGRGLGRGCPLALSRMTEAKSSAPKGSLEK